MFCSLPASLLLLCVLDEDAPPGGVHNLAPPPRFFSHGAGATLSSPTAPRPPPSLYAAGWLSLLLLLLGFAMSVLWTNAIANELVAALTFTGSLLGVSPGVLGLTVLAWGNSIGDFVADTSLARAGNPRMGAASCFGSPLFNMLIGFGASLSYATYTKGDFHLPADHEVPLAFGFLVGSCVLSGVVLPLRGFHLTKRYGVVLVLYYCVFLVCSLLLWSGILLVL